MYGGAWGEAADANKMNWPVPVLLVRLPGTHTVSSKFWGGKKKKTRIGTENWEQASSRTGPKPDYIVSSSFLNELKKIHGFFLVAWFYSG